MFRKTTLIVTMLVAAAQIHPEISCSKLLRTDKTADSKTAAGNLSACPHPACAVYLGLVLCRNKYKRAIIARFRNVAKGNIKAYIRCCNPNTSNEARRSCRFRR